MFDIRDHLDQLRCRPTEWLRARRAELVREERRLGVERLAVTRVLDERDTLDENVAAQDGVSERTAREAKETARALERLPHVADAAHAGRLSGEQLGPVAQLADEARMRSGPSGHRGWRRWIWPAPSAANANPPPPRARPDREARHLRMWWSDPNTKTGMLNLRGQLADLDGSLFENTINEMIEQMRPPKGQPWDTREHRAADALLQLCQRANQHCDHPTPKRAPKPLLVVEVPLSGPATVAGIPLPDTVVEQLHANATIEPVLVDDHGAPLLVGRRFPGLSDKIAHRGPAAATRTAAAAPATCATASTSTTSYPAPGVAATTSPTSPRCAPSPATTRCSSPTVPGPWSATPTSPTACAWSATPISPPTKPATTASHHPHEPAPDAHGATRSNFPTSTLTTA